MPIKWLNVFTFAVRCATIKKYTHQAQFVVRSSWLVARRLPVAIPHKPIPNLRIAEYSRRRKVWFRHTSCCQCTCVYANFDGKQTKKISSASMADITVNGNRIQRSCELVCRSTSMWLRWTSDERAPGIAFAGEPRESQCGKENRWEYWNRERIWFGKIRSLLTALNNVRLSRSPQHTSSYPLRTTLQMFGCARPCARLKSWHTIACWQSAVIMSPDKNLRAPSSSEPNHENGLLRLLLLRTPYIVLCDCICVALLVQSANLEWFALFLRWFHSRRFCALSLAACEHSKTVHSIAE